MILFRIEISQTVMPSVSRPETALAVAVSLMAVLLRREHEEAEDYEQNLNEHGMTTIDEKTNRRSTAARARGGAFAGRRGPAGGASGSGR